MRQNSTAANTTGDARPACSLIAAAAPLRHPAIALAMALIVIGCINPYARFYRGYTDPRRLPQYIRVPGSPRIIDTADLTADLRRLVRQGYEPIGLAFFNAPANAFERDQLLEQAKTLGASVVLATSRYSHTQSGAMPVTFPQTSTTHTSGSATAYGPYGSTTVYGATDSTTSTSQTLIIPYSITLNDYGAIFFIKTKPQPLGIWPVEIDNATRQRLQRNGGIAAFEVIDGSPAYKADILPDDVLLTIDGTRIESVEHFWKLTLASQGRNVQILVDRHGTEIEKTVQLRAVSSTQN